MDQIRVKDLSKEYKVLHRQEGIVGAIKDLFSRDYDYIKAVKGINFSIRKGEIVGFLGANGAGKSTTIKMMTGLIKPTSGEIDIFGQSPFIERNTFLKNIGVLFGQKSQLWWEVPVIESFKLCKDVYDIEKHVYNETLDMFDELAGIKEFYNIPAKNLSLGQRMLCDVVASFLHQPKILFLDEPTIGLDVNIKAKLRKIIRYLNESKKTTVILTTHDVGDIEELAKRILLIDKGNLIFDGDIADFNHLFGSYKTIVLKWKEEKNLKAIIYGLKEDVSRFHDTHITIEDHAIQIVVNNISNDMNHVMGMILTKYHSDDISIRDVSIESVLQRVYQGESNYKKI